MAYVTFSVYGEQTSSPAVGWARRDGRCRRARRRSRARGAARARGRASAARARAARRRAGAPLATTPATAQNLF